MSLQTHEVQLLNAVETRTVPVYALDVECVATGPTHLDRAVAQIGLVDDQLRVVLNLYVKPTFEVMSYLTPLTGLTASLIDAEGVPLADALAKLREYLPSSAVLVGTNIGQDVKWLGLRALDDYASLLDLSALFRVWDSSKKRYSYFSQDHVAKAWLGHARPSGQSHDAVGDSVISMMLLFEFLRVRHNSQHLSSLREKTVQLPREPSFAVRHAVFEGVCQGNRRLCTCGAPHFS